MRLDELITQTTIHENTKVMVDRRVTMASRTALTGCAAATLIFNRTKADDATNLASWVVDWFGYPAAGFTYPSRWDCALPGDEGFNQANENEHKAIVGFTIAAAITVVPIVLAVVVWVLFVVAIIVMFAATIGFAVLVLWALTQIN